MSKYTAIEVGSRHRLPGVGIVLVLRVDKHKVVCLYGGGMVEISKAHLRSGWKLQPR